ncbi:MAG: tetratricopeptide repeat protein [Bacteroidia bacterium]
MDTSDSRYRRLDAYFEETLSETESKEIELLIETDTAWQNAYQQMYETRQAIRSYQLATLKNDLRSQYEQDNQEKVHFLSQIPTSFYYGAAAILLLLVMVWLLPIQPSTTNQSLYVAHFEPMIDIVTYLGPDKDSLMSAMEYYNQQDYSNAIIWLEKLSDHHATYPLARLYLANAYLSSGQYTKAEPPLRSLLSDTTYNEYAQWYLVLSLLGQERREEAKNLLINLDDSEPVFKANSIKELLAKLE